MINLMKHCASTQVWAMYVHLPSLDDSGGRALSFRLSAPTSALQTGLSLTTLKQQPAALMGLNISYCEHLCDYIHHSRDTCACAVRRKPSKNSTFADAGQWKVGQRGPPCPFVYIITQVLSVHAACLLVSRPLFQMTSSTHTLQYDLQLTSREARIAPLGMWLLDILQVRWKSKWIFKKPVVLSQLSGGGTMYLGLFEQGVEWWSSGSTSTMTTKSRPCRRLTSTQAFTALLLVESDQRWWFHHWWVWDTQVPPPEHHRRAKVCWLFCWFKYSCWSGNLRLYGDACHQFKNHLGETVAPAL